MKLSRKPYIYKPLFISLPVAVASTFGMFFIDCTKINDLIQGIVETVTSFSLTFIAFSVTALALLSLAQNQPYFQTVAKSSYFKSFFGRFILSTKYSIVLFLTSLVVRFLFILEIVIMTNIVVGILLGSLFFISFWVWQCIDDLISIFKEDDAC